MTTPQIASVASFTAAEMTSTFTDEHALQRRLEEGSLIVLPIWNAFFGPGSFTAKSLDNFKMKITEVVGDLKLQRDSAELFADRFRRMMTQGGIEHVVHELADVKRVNTELSAALAAVKLDNINIREELTDVKRENVELRAEVAAVQRQNVELRAELADVKRENVELRAELADTKRELADLKRTVAELLVAMAKK